MAGYLQNNYWSLATVLAGIKSACVDSKWNKKRWNQFCGTFKLNPRRRAISGNVSRRRQKRDVWRVLTHCKYPWLSAIQIERLSVLIILRRTTPPSVFHLILTIAPNYGLMTRHIFDLVLYVLFLSLTSLAHLHQEYQRKIIFNKLMLTEFKYIHDVIKIHLIWLSFKIIPWKRDLP